MKILLTNDDGINSPGITLLADALRKAGHRVFVVAPAFDNSGVSHSISFLNGPCKLVETGTDTWSCEGTPVDCIIVALMGGIPELNVKDEMGNWKHELPVDCILSGINRGANLGTDIVYSGTAAAARQGALFNFPSVALSLVEGNRWNWEGAASFIQENLEKILAYWKPHSFVNVNIPNKPEKPLALLHAFPCFRYYNDSIKVYHAPDGHRYCYADAGNITISEKTSGYTKGAKPEHGTDYEAVEENYASISEIYIHPLLLESLRGEV